jgi:two-component system phosphate regulon sensor histidine kinase PhoR
MIVRDLTERERIAKDRERLFRDETRARRALARQNRRLRELDELKDELVSTVSHELRTPLTSIQGFLELLDDEDAGPLTADQRRYVDSARASSALLLRIVQDLLDLARLDVQGMHPSRQAVDLDAIARGVVEELRAAARAAGMDLRLDEGLVETVCADPGMLARVVRNLVENAVKFGEAGHTVTLRTARDDERVLLEVENVGVSIPKREQRKIFDRFARGSNAIRGNVGGSGLGLAIAKAIVDAHGGTLSVRSARRSTTFTVSLPTGRPPLDADAAPGRRCGIRRRPEPG